MLAAAMFSILFVIAAPARAPADVIEKPPGKSPAKAPFRWKRAVRDLGPPMALGVAWYVSQIEVNKLDFDFDRTWSEQVRRLTTRDGFRFDDNNRFLNVGHSFTGATYHLVARVHGGSMVQAMLLDLTASSAWELTVEHREVFSLNDTVTTSIGAVALGESLFRLGELFARSRPTPVHRVLMAVFSPARAVAWAYGDAPRPTRAGFDGFGLATDARHRFAFSLGGTASLATGGHADADGWQGSLAADLELIDVASYGEPGQVSAALGGGEMTRLIVEFTGGAVDMQTLTALARSSLWGTYRQDTAGAGGDDVHGYAAFLGSSTAFDLSYNDVGALTDFLMVVHTIGPTADLTLHRAPWRLRLAADLYPDFAMVRPFASGGAATRPDDVPGQSVLRHDYYYAVGLTAAARAEAAYRRLRARAAVEWSRYEAIDALDRHEHAYTSPAGVRHEAIVHDPRMADERLKLRIDAESPIPFAGFAIGAAVEYLRRTGTATGSRREADDLRLGVHAIYAL